MTENNNNNNGIEKGTGVQNSEGTQFKTDDANTIAASAAGVAERHERFSIRSSLRRLMAIDPEEVGEMTVKQMARRIAPADKKPSSAELAAAQMYAKSMEGDAKGTKALVDLGEYYEGKPPTKVLTAEVTLEDIVNGSYKEEGEDG